MGKNIRQCVITITLAMTVLWSQAIFPIYAISDGNVSVFPSVTKEYPGNRSWFVYQAAGGTVIKDKIDVINDDDKTNTIKIAVLDGAITSDGGYTLVGGKDQNKDVGTWATLSREEIVLPPHKKQILDLTITVPQNADVGSHAGGVVIWRDSTNSNQSKGSNLKVVTRVAARLYLTVPGDIQRKLDISNVNHKIDHGVLYFLMDLRNSGNVSLTPEADIKLSGFFGLIGEQKGSALGMLLRNTAIKGKTPWQKRAPWFGRFVADMRIHYGEKDFKGDYVKDEYQDVRYVFWIIPWMTLLWVVLGLLALILIRKFWLWILIRQRLNTKTKEHLVKKGESLTSIANLYGKNAKAIAKFNFLKWPYDLAVGDILLIPQGKMTKEEQKLSIRHSETPHPTSPYQGEERRGYSGMTRGGLELVIIEAGDTLKTVAEFAGVSVQEIARINQIKWPYKLRVGQELFIPDQQEGVNNVGRVEIKVKSATGKAKPAVARRIKLSGRMKSSMKTKGTNNPSTNKKKPRR